MRLKKICIYEWGPKEFLSPSLGLHVLLFFKVLLYCLFMFVVAQCPGSGEYLQLVGQRCSHSDGAGPFSHSRLFQWLQHCVNFAPLQETLFAFLEYHFK